MKMYAELMRKCTVCNEEKNENEFYNWKHEHRCKKCISAIRKKKYAENPQPTKDRVFRYRKNFPNKIKHTKLMQSMGVSFEQFKALMEKQNGLCAICKRPEKTIWRGKKTHLAVDHCHETGKIRSLLCQKCNRALGLMEENINFILAMVDYIKNHKK